MTIILSIYNNVVLSKCNVIRLHIFTSESTLIPADVLILSEEQSSPIYNLTLASACNSTTRPRLKLIVHGFGTNWTNLKVNTSKDFDWISAMKDELLKLDDANEMCVLIVDWAELASIICFRHSKG
jgi:hypothetical protein